MPDRAIIPLTVAVMGGFFCGLLCSVLQLLEGPTVTIAVAGAAASAMAAAASVVGTPGENRGQVAVLRVFYGVLLFLAIDFGLVTFLRDARPLAALALLLLAGLSAAMLAAPRVREPRRRDGAQPTT